jgi:prevent-host-death family protein
MSWNLSEAKNRLSEVLTRAGTKGPQTITRKGEAYVVLPQSQYEELIGKRPKFKDWVLNGPRIDDLELPARNRATMREVEL